MNSRPAASKFPTVTRKRRFQLIALLCVASIFALAIFTFVNKQRATELHRATRDSNAANPSAQNTQRRSSDGTKSTPQPLAQVPGSRPDWQSVDDPTQDGWTSEHRAQQAQDTLKHFLQSLLAQEATNRLMGSVAEDYTGTTWFVQDAAVQYDRDRLNVQRWTKPVDGELALVQGHEGFVKTYQDLQRDWAGAKSTNVAIKVIEVNAIDDLHFETLQRIELNGRLPDGLREQHFLWRTTWEESSRVGRSDTHNVRLTKVVLEDYESSRIDHAIFADATQRVILDLDAYSRQMMHGIDEWLDRSQDLRYFSPLGNPGLAVGDINGDGLEDLYVCQEHALPNRLYIQQPDGTAREASSDWQVDWIENSRSALLLDLDNDGDQDLVVAILGGVIVAENVGDQFAIRNVLATDDDTTSICAADYDLDGDLDLYVCVDYPNDYFAELRSFEANRREAHPDYSILGGAGNRVYHDSNEAGHNSLFRNDIKQGNWGFVDVTEAVGLSINNRRFSWAASWEDFDQDGDPDLYVANDFGQNNLYRNDAGRFTDVAATMNAGDRASGMSTDWGDYDRDGDLDLYIANMFSSAGSRVTGQAKFKDDATDQTRQRLRHFSRGNTLLVNDTPNSFSDVSVEAGVTVGRWAWSSVFSDINNDGWQDLLVANGYITAESTSDL